MRLADRESSPRRGRRFCLLYRRRFGSRGESGDAGYHVLADLTHRFDYRGTVWNLQVGNAVVAVHNCEPGQLSESDGTRGQIFTRLGELFCQFGNVVGVVEGDAQLREKGLE